MGVVNGNAIFEGNSVNGGTVTGSATFNDNSANGPNGIVNGGATLGPCAANVGEVQGTVINNQSGVCPENFYRQIQIYNPPLFCHWVTNSGVGTQRRRLVCLGSRNQEQLGNTIYGGPWRDCPSGGCFTDPAEYRPYATVSYVLDYENYPFYEQE